MRRKFVSNTGFKDRRNMSDFIRLTRVNYMRMRFYLMRNGTLEGFRASYLYRGRIINPQQARNYKFKKRKR